MFADSTFQERSDKSLSPLLKFGKKLVAPDCVAMLPNAGGSHVSPQIWVGEEGFFCTITMQRSSYPLMKKKLAERTQQIKVSLSFLSEHPNSRHTDARQLPMVLGHLTRRHGLGHFGQASAHGSSCTSWYDQVAGFQQANHCNNFIERNHNAWMTSKSPHHSGLWLRKAPANQWCFHSLQYDPQSLKKCFMREQIPSKSSSTAARGTGLKSPEAPRSASDPQTCQEVWVFLGASKMIEEAPFLWAFLESLLVNMRFKFRAHVCISSL